jgi:hypothetical protein
MADWENCKENYQPLKKGRSVLKQNDFQDKLKFSEKNMEFITKIEAAKNDPTVDLLELFVEYYSWMRRNSQDSEKAKAILEVSRSSFISQFFPTLNEYFCRNALRI